MLALLVGCGPRGQSATELAQRQQARQLAELSRQYDAALHREDFALAQILGNLVLTQHPASPEAQRIRPGFAVVQVRAEAQRDHKRQADLWTYHAVPQADGKGTVYTGFLWAQAEPGSPLPAVRLVLRNHPEWGLSAYLLAESGVATSPHSTPLVPHPPAVPTANGAGAAVSPYRCELPACSIRLSFDDGPEQAYTAYEPDQAGTGALFIEEYPRLIQAIGSNHWLRIDLPVAGGTRPIRFEVGGFVATRLSASSTP